MVWDLEKRFKEILRDFILIQWLREEKRDLEKRFKESLRDFILIQWLREKSRVFSAFHSCLIFAKEYVDPL